MLIHPWQKWSPQVTSPLRRWDIFPALCNPNVMYGDFNRLNGVVLAIFLKFSSDVSWSERRTGRHAHEMYKSSFSRWAGCSLDPPISRSVRGNLPRWLGFQCEAPKEIAAKSKVKTKFSCIIRVYHRSIYCREYRFFVSLTSVWAWKNSDVSEVWTGTFNCDSLVLDSEFSLQFCLKLVNPFCAEIHLVVNCFDSNSWQTSFV